MKLYTNVGDDPDYKCVDVGYDDEGNTVYFYAKVDDLKLYETFVFLAKRQLKLEGLEPELTQDDLEDFEMYAEESIEDIALIVRDVVEAHKADACIKELMEIEISEEEKTFQAGRRDIISTIDANKGNPDVFLIKTIISACNRGEEFRPIVEKYYFLD